MLTKKAAEEGSGFEPTEDTAETGTASAGLDGSGTGDAGDSSARDTGGSGARSVAATDSVMPAIVIALGVVLLAFVLMVGGVISSHPLQAVAQETMRAQKVSPEKKSGTGSSMNRGDKAKEADEVDGENGPVLPEEPVEADSAVKADAGVDAADTDDEGSDGVSSGNSGGASASDDGADIRQPTREWVPAWDEWVESGHWETSQVHHPAEYGERSIIGAVCNDCGFATADAETMRRHVRETLHSGYSTGRVIGTERYLVQDAWVEDKSVWIDTSHWVHHEGYWK